jgi:hypothetical protein
MVANRAHRRVDRRWRTGPVVMVAYPRDRTVSALCLHDHWQFIGSTRTADFLKRYYRCTQCGAVSIRLDEYPTVYDDGDPDE